MPTAVTFKKNRRSWIQAKDEVENRKKWRITTMPLISIGEDKDCNLEKIKSSERQEISTTRLSMLRK